MTTAAEYLRLTTAEANSAATSAVNVQNQVAVAETFANTATTYANAVGASVAAAADFSTSSGLKAIESKNYRDLALLWANADPNVIVEDNFYSARHYAQLTIGMLAVMQANLDTHSQEYIDNKTVTDNALAYLGYRLDNGVLVYDSSVIDGSIADLETAVDNELASKLSTVLYNYDKLGLAAFAKSNDISTNNKIIDYLDEAGQIALQAMITGASNQTKLSYAGVVVSPETGIITSAAGSALATEYGVRVAAIEETIGSSSQPGLGTIQAKYTIKTDANGHVAGFGLINTANTDITSHGFSEFIINADSFKVSGSAAQVAPFRVITDGGTPNGGVCISSLGVETGGVTQDYCEDTLGGAWSGPGLYVSNAYILSAVMDMAQVKGTLTASHIDAGFITAEMLDVDAINAEVISVESNIEFGGTSSGLHFGKTSLGDSQAGAFFGRSGGVAGFNISSATSGIYADSTGQVNMNNVRLYAGVAGDMLDYPNPGTYSAAISPLTDSITVIIIGGGGGSSNNASGTLGGGHSGSSGTASYIQWWSGAGNNKGTGTLLGTYTAAGGAGLAHGNVGPNASYLAGYAGMPSSKAAGGSGGAAGGGAPGHGSFGSGGGGGGGGAGQISQHNAPVYGRAAAGATISQILTKPSGANSITMHVGTGGIGGEGQSQTYNNNTGDWNGFSLVAGGNGGNGFVSYADPNSGGVEIDLQAILERLTALEA